MSRPEETRSAQPAEQAGEQSLLDQIVDEGRFGRDTVARERGRDLIKEFVTQFLEGSMTVSRDTEAMINARIAQIDHLVSIQLNEVLHHPQFLLSIAAVKLFSTKVSTMCTTTNCRS